MWCGLLAAVIGAAQPAADVVLSAGNSQMFHPAVFTLAQSLRLRRPVSCGHGRQSSRAGCGCVAARRASGTLT